MCAINDKPKSQLCEQLNHSFKTNNVTQLSEMMSSPNYSVLSSGSNSSGVGSISYATPLANQYRKGRTVTISLLLATLFLAPQNHLSFA